MKDASAAAAGAESPPPQAVRQSAVSTTSTLAGAVRQPCLSLEKWVVTKGLSCGYCRHGLFEKIKHDF
ncbi:hypothetical protein [Polaromonas glacialis]|uniref:hypothetical protein n=1 Tax=Polaromonas glacialis TaxID=866564 RepID=UPI0004972F5A|nr:hypothetical protein [Polaromonas glacialis]